MSTGDGQRARVVQTQTEGHGGDLHGHGEAGVEIEAGYVVEAATDGVEQRLAGLLDGRRAVKLRALQRVEDVVQVGHPEREHPTVARDPGGLCRFHRAQQECRRLVDLDDGVHPLGVRLCDHSVAGGRLGQFLRGGPAREPGQVGVRRGHLGRRGHELPEEAALLVEASAGVVGHR